MERLIHGGDIASYRNLRVDFSANLNPLGLPQGVKAALSEHLQDCAVYPDPACRALRTAIGELEAVSPEAIVCGNGAADLIFRLVQAVRPKQALVLAPTFSEYELALQSVGCQVRHHFLRAAQFFQPDDSLLDAITPELDCCFLCNPNNPTGVVMDGTLLERVVERCRERSVLLVVDECFLDFTIGQSAKAFLVSNPYLVVLKAFTKTFAMAGLRLGYCITENESLRNRMLTVAQPWSVSTLAQIAGIAATTEQAYLRRSIQYIKEQRNYLRKEICRLGIKVYPSEANFLLLESELPLFSSLLEQGILIRHCDNYVGLDANFYRIAVRTASENSLLIKSLEGICDGKIHYDSGNDVQCREEFADGGNLPDFKAGRLSGSAF